jgi:endonuclease/exonuclease/phosphatase family metal-dependent hydrolase
MKHAARITTLVVTAIALCASPVTGSEQLPPERPPPPGQVQVVSVNAKQARVLDVERFERLLALTLALRSRPAAFDGGSSGAVAAPDVIVLQEMSFSNLEIFRRLLNQRSENQYEIATTPNAKPKFLYNATTVALHGEPVGWTDPCVPASAEDPGREYQWARFTQNVTGVLFVVAGVHFQAKYEGPGRRDCRLRNVEALRSQLEAETGPVIIAGDFNRRATAEFRECDVEEQTDPTRWWGAMTSPPEGGKVYNDAIREWHRRHGASMVDEWTHEQKGVKVTCEGVSRNRRTRIDYFFVNGVTTAEAHADHPGWAGPEPGTTDPANARYSDHRFVWGRFVLAGPPPPQSLTAEQDEAGVVHLSWTPSEGAAAYVVYRATGDLPYDVLAQIGAEATSYDDVSAEHGNAYRYAIAPVDANGRQGLETAPARVTVDTVGPRVVDVDPNKGASRVRRDVVVGVRFNEAIDPTSVRKRTVSLRRKGARARGDVAQLSDDELTFTPDTLLRKRSTYTVTVRSVSDLAGNEGNIFRSAFRTASR